MVKYSKGKYWADGKELDASRIRAYTRRKLRDSPGKALDVDLLGGRSIKKTGKTRR
jgi:hypothetical protein